MRVTSTEPQYVVSLSGPLHAHDMRRLEQVCGPALEQPRIPLTLNLRAATSIDAAAHAYLKHLEARGATVRYR
jgi:hypothetical protein